MSKEQKAPRIANEPADKMLDAAMSVAFGSKSDAIEADQDESSTTIGRYKLLQQIGEGGFGVVYMAEQQEPIRRRVALKIIKLGMDTKQVVARFEAERQALAMMDHENIASVLDAGATENGRPFFVMELVRGVPITEYCNRNKLNTRQRLALFVSVCKAVRHAHQKGIIHRDLKPNNVLVTLRDGIPIPKVIDFGVAKATQARLTEKTVFTRFGQFIGTPAYMSPEQVEMSELDVDTRSDIYSLGVLLYELLTGSTPIEHGQLKQAGYVEMQRMICEQEPPKPSTRLSHSGEALATISAQRATEPKKLGQTIRGDLDWIVMKTLEKDRTRRYETTNELSADILRYLNNEPVMAGPPSAAYKFRKFVHRKKKLLGAAAAMTLLMLLATVVSTWQAIRAYQAEKTAQVERDVATEIRDELLVEQGRRQVERVEALLTTAPESVPLLVDELSASRESVLSLIRARFKEANRLEDRLRLAIAQTLLDDPQLEFLAENVDSAQPNECANLVKAFRSHRDQALPLLQQRFESADSEQSRFRLAVLMLELGNPQAAARLLVWNKDPSIRTKFIHGFRIWRGDLAAIADVLRASRQGEVQSGLALALGRLDPLSVAADARSEILDALLDVYLNTDDGGAHSACGWALRRWNSPLPPIEADVAHPTRRWFVGAGGQTMILFGAESINTGPSASTGAAQFPWPFAIADRETSVALFRRFLDDPDCPAELKPHDWPGVDVELVPSDDCPVHRLSPADIVLFCNWLSRAEKRQVCYEQDENGIWWCRYDRNGYRLPAFDEWEYACYAGATSKFPFGDDEFMLPEYGNLLLRRTQPGAKSMPNDLGVFDMLGNLWDLCHTTGVLSIVANPRQPFEWRTLSIRGATFGAGSYYLSRNRFHGAARERSTDVGFRVACRINSSQADGMQLSPETAIAWMDYRIAADPDNVSLRLQRAKQHIQHQRWREAAVDYQTLIPLQPDEDHHWLEAAELLAQLEDTDEYRRHCRLMLERFGDTDDPLVADRTCMACLLLPNAIDEPEVVFQLAEKAISGDIPDWARGYTQAAKGLADYRANRFADVIQRLEKNRQVITEAQPFLLELNLAVLAMAYHATDQQESAQALLEECASKIDAAVNDPSGRHWIYWRDLLMAQIMCREAQALIDNP